MNTAAKGKRLEQKSIRWLLDDGALLVIRGRGTPRQEKFPEGIAQVDLVAIYPNWSVLVEVTVPSHVSRARARLRGLPKVDGWSWEILVWADYAKEPKVIRVEEAAR